MVTVPRDSSVSLTRRGSLSEMLRPPIATEIGFLTSSENEDPVELIRLFVRLKIKGWIALFHQFIGLFFLQNNLLISKNGTQRTHKTNHYILLTNISIKRCIKPHLKPIYLGGGRVPTRQVPYRQQQVLSMSHMFIYMNRIKKMS